MRLLCLSNGHGEDKIAIRVLQALQQQPNSPSIEALPIVGEGHVYQKAGIPVIGSVKAMPSGGFIYMDGRQLVRDIQGGLLQLTIAQIKAIRAWAKSGRKGGRGEEPSLILAVGDIVPLLFAWMSGIPYAFVGTAKSEYHLRDEKGWLPRKSWWDDRLERSTGCVYQPWERWLMKRSNCKAVFPRDHITADILKRFRVPAFDLGNPMMDGLEWTDEFSYRRSAGTSLQIALIPGSRAPECYANWEMILRSLNHLVGKMNRPIELLAAIAPGLDREEFHRALLDHRWQPIDSDSYSLGIGDNKATLTLFMAERFSECVQRADVAIAMAGTATEQFIGLGKPAITIPGSGPQFTPAFAEAQTRLLGASITLVEQPEQVAPALQSLFNNPDRLQAIAENGRHRMGEPGAAKRIAACLIAQMKATN